MLPRNCDPKSQRRNDLKIKLMKTHTYGILKRLVGSFPSVQMNKMPSPVEEESTTLNKTMEKGVETKGQDNTVCKCDNYDPTTEDTNNNENCESTKKSSKFKEDSSCEPGEKKKFIMDEDRDTKDFIVSFSCSQCTCIAYRDYSDDKEIRKRKKTSKRCFCLTLSFAVIFCVSVIASLSYLTFSILSNTNYDNQNQGLSNFGATAAPLVYEHRNEPSRVRSSVAKYELDVDEFEPATDKVLPWKQHKGSRPVKTIYSYNKSNNSISVLESGDYYVQVTLSADTHLFPSGDLVTIIPCIRYNRNDNCQRMKIPAGMAVPIHLQEVVHLESYDTIKVTVLSKTNCIYTSALHNILTIVRLH